MKLDLIFEVTSAVCGLIILVAGTYVLYVIYKGSKSTFAYSLLFFTILDGLYWGAIMPLQIRYQNHYRVTYIVEDVYMIGVL